MEQEITNKPTTDPGEGCTWHWDGVDQKCKRSCANGSDDNNGHCSNNGNGDDNNGGEATCDTYINSGDLPLAVTNAMVGYSNSGWYIKSVRMCKECNKIVRYVIEIDGISKITLVFNPDGTKNLPWNQGSEEKFEIRPGSKNNAGIFILKV